MSLYQLVGWPGMTPGQTVDMCPGGHRYGRVQAVLEPNYKLPNPCVMVGPTKPGKTEGLTLYLLRGLDDYTSDRHLPSVWGWRA